jgi:hypothetical protein
MYLKAVSTARVAMTASGPSRSASRCAPTTFAPAEIPAKTPSSRGSEPARHLERLIVLDRVYVVDPGGVPVRDDDPAQPCIANAPRCPPRG